MRKLSEKDVTVYSYDDAPDGVECFVTTRAGGYSRGAFSGMNMAVYTEDDPKSVIKNTELLKSAYGLDNLTTLCQVHGKDVHKVTKSNRTDVLFSEGDGLFTTEENFALGVLTADCYNLFMAGEEGIAALHCGHKSVSAGIMTEGVRMFERHSDFPVFAGIGPGISAENYEVGEELAEKFAKICEESVKIIDGRFHLCIRTVIEANLRAHGVERISHIENCSYADENLYSYRRDSGNTGRMLGVIVRKGDV